MESYIPIFNIDNHNINCIVLGLFHVKIKKNSHSSKLKNRHKCKIYEKCIMRVKQILGRDTSSL